MLKPRVILTSIDPPALVRARGYRGGGGMRDGGERRGWAGGWVLVRERARARSFIDNQEVTEGR